MRYDLLTPAALNAAVTWASASDRLVTRDWSTGYSSPARPRPARAQLPQELPGACAWIASRTARATTTARASRGRVSTGARRACRGGGHQRQLHSAAAHHGAGCYGAGYTAKPVIVYPNHTMRRSSSGWRHLAATARRSRSKP